MDRSDPIDSGPEHDPAEATADLLNVLTGGVLVCDSAGCTLHMNRSLAEMLRMEPDICLPAAIQSVVRGLTRRRREVCRDGAAGPPPDPQVRTARGVYRVRGIVLERNPFVRGWCVVVSVERVTPGLPSAPDLRERYGMTAREAEVALLLAEGKSNAVIAATLSVGSRTAASHTERVLLKLGVRSRAQVGPKLMEP